VVELAASGAQRLFYRVQAIKNFHLLPVYRLRQPVYVPDNDSVSGFLHKLRTR
jgi:hypothetical protein